MNQAKKRRAAAEQAAADQLDAAIPSESAAEAPAHAYSVTLPGAEGSEGPSFEGPLDLLLHLCQKHELNILEIPIGFVTEKYLEYLAVFTLMNLDVASEYLVMAATLAHIKSKMLLPAPPPGQEDEIEGDEEDPRESLIRRLLEYQKYKRAGEDLQARGVAGRDVFLRGIPIDEAVHTGLPPLAQVPLFSLVEAFQAVLSKSKVKISHDIVHEGITLADRINELVDVLRVRKRIGFEDLFREVSTRFDLVITFLALLEMTRLRMTRLFQTDIDSTIYIEFSAAVTADDESPTDDTAAPAAAASPQIDPTPIESTDTKSTDAESTDAESTDAESHVEADSAHVESAHSPSTLEPAHVDVESMDSSQSEAVDPAHVDSAPQNVVASAHVDSAHDVSTHVEPTLSDQVEAVDSAHVDAAHADAAHADAAHADSAHSDVASTLGAAHVDSARVASTHVEPTLTSQVEAVHAVDSTQSDDSAHVASTHDAPALVDHIESIESHESEPAHVDSAHLDSAQSPDPVEPVESDRVDVVEPAVIESVRDSGVDEVRLADRNAGEAAVAAVAGETGVAGVADDDYALGSAMDTEPPPAEMLAAEHGREDLGVVAEIAVGEILVDASAEEIAGSNNRTIPSPPPGDGDGEEEDDEITDTNALPSALRWIDPTTGDSKSDDAPAAGDGNGNGNGHTDPGSKDPRS